MDEIKIGDIVSRKSYNNDVFFRVCGKIRNPDEDIFLLKGICCRIIADSPASDLVIQPQEKVKQYLKNNFENLENNYSSREMILDKK